MKKMHSKIKILKMPILFIAISILILFFTMAVPYIRTYVSEKQMEFQGLKRYHVKAAPKALQDEILKKYFEMEKITQQ